MGDDESGPAVQALRDPRRYPDDKGFYNAVVRASREGAVPNRKINFYK
jgi:hypothetical protein